MAHYRKYRNVFNKLVKLAKRNHYSSTLKSAIHDMKRTWMILKEIIGKTKPKTSIPSKLNVFQEQSFLLQLEDPVLIAEYFNSFYTTVAERTINPTNNSDHTNPLSFLNHIHVDNTFFLHPTNTSEIITTCMSIKSKRSTGHDNISNVLIKNIILQIAVPLTHIFNASFASGIFPTTLN